MQQFLLNQDQLGVISEALTADPQIAKIVKAAMLIFTLQPVQISPAPAPEEKPPADKPNGKAEPEKDEASAS